MLHSMVTAFKLYAFVFLGNCCVLFLLTASSHGETPETTTKTNLNYASAAALERYRLRSSEFKAKIQSLAEVIIRELEEDYRDVLQPDGEMRTLLHRPNNFRLSVGVSVFIAFCTFHSLQFLVDPNGKASSSNSAVYLWSWNGTESGSSIATSDNLQANQDTVRPLFANTTRLFDYPQGKFPVELSNHMGDFVSLLPGFNIYDANYTTTQQPSRRVKRKGGSAGGGGGRGGGFSGARGMSAARSASASGRFSSSSGGRSALSVGGKAGSFGSGTGGYRPFIWVYVGGSGYVPRSAYSADENFDYTKDVDSDVVRMEVSLCFGRHKSRESCSAKVDAMVEKFAHAKFTSSGTFASVNALTTLSFMLLTLCVLWAVTCGDHLL